MAVTLVEPTVALPSVVPEDQAKLYPLLVPPANTESIKSAEVEVAVAAGNTQAVTVIGSRVPVELAERVRRAAEAERRTISNFARCALEHEVQRVDAERSAA